MDFGGRAGKVQEADGGRLRLLGSDLERSDAVVLYDDVIPNGAESPVRNLLWLVAPDAVVRGTGPSKAAKSGGPAKFPNMNSTRTKFACGP